MLKIVKYNTLRIKFRNIILPLQEIIQSRDPHQQQKLALY